MRTSHHWRIYAMPWDETYYPRSMRNLPLEVRLKAIGIANAFARRRLWRGRRLSASRSPRPRKWSNATDNRGRSGHLSLQRLRSSFRNLLSRGGLRKAADGGGRAEKGSQTSKWKSCKPETPNWSLTIVSITLHVLLKITCPVCSLVAGGHRPTSQPSARRS